MEFQEIENGDENDSIKNESKDNKHESGYDSRSFWFDALYYGLNAECCGEYIDDGHHSCIEKH